MGPNYIPGSKAASLEEQFSFLKCAELWQFPSELTFALFLLRSEISVLFIAKILADRPQGSRQTISHRVLNCLMANLKIQLASATLHCAIHIFNHLS